MGVDSSMTFLGNFNGREMAVDPETGYLQATEGYKLAGFTAALKVRFISAAKKLWPNVSAICQIVGIHPGTFQNHYKADVKFREDLELVKAERLDLLEGVMFDNATQPRGFLDRIATLKAHRPERWNPDYRMTITHDVQISRTILSEAAGGEQCRTVDGELAAPGSELGPALDGPA